MMKRFKSSGRKNVCFIAKTLSDRQDGVLTSTENNSQLVPKNTAACRRWRFSVAKVLPLNFGFCAQIPQKTWKRKSTDHQDGTSEKTVNGGAEVDALKLLFCLKNMDLKIFSAQNDRFWRNIELRLKIHKRYQNSLMIRGNDEKWYRFTIRSFWQNTAIPRRDYL